MKNQISRRFHFADFVRAVMSFFRKGSLEITTSMQVLICRINLFFQQFLFDENSKIPLPSGDENSTTPFRLVISCDLLFDENQRMTAACTFESSRADILWGRSYLREGGFYPNYHSESRDNQKMLVSMYLNCHCSNICEYIFFVLNLNVNENG